MIERDERLRDRRILIVEDDFHVADSLSLALRASGAHVVGPAATVSAALKLVASCERVDGAVLDINLRGEVVYPVADALRRRGVPFVFATGYDGGSVALHAADVVCIEKPVTIAQIGNALFR